MAFDVEKLIAEIPFWDCVAEEIFKVPPRTIFSGRAATPRTTEEIGKVSGYSADKVRSRIREIHAQSRGILINDTEARQFEDNNEVFVLDFRRSNTESISPAHALDLDELRPTLTSKNLILIRHESDERAFSAAMYLRGEGFANVKAVVLRQYQSVQ